MRTTSIDYSASAFLGGSYAFKEMLLDAILSARIERRRKILQSKQSRKCAYCVRTIAKILGFEYAM